MHSHLSQSFEELCLKPENINSGNERTNLLKFLRSILTFDFKESVLCTIVNKFSCRF
jgi:hypothetical protein